ncbi:hypothetical protein P9112_007054 [Eukaryota sp. TZLM1-RC]
MSNKCYCGQAFSNSNIIRHLTSCDSFKNISPLFSAVSSAREWMPPEMFEHEITAIYEIFCFADSLPAVATPSDFTFADDRPMSPSDNSITCNHCNFKSSDITQFCFLDCEHVVCLNDIKSTIHQHFPSPVLCPLHDCNFQLSMMELRDIVGDETLSKLDSDALNRTLGQGVIAYCTCGVSFVLDQGEVQVVDERGKPMNPKAGEHKSKYRGRCGSCGNVFCAQCKESPYHDGFTCDAWVDFKNSRHCKWCEGVIDSNDPHVVVCQDEQCGEKEREACPEVLVCGHFCRGSGDHDCFCLECNGNIGDEFCNICFIDPLKANICVSLECGHYFHRDCLVEQISNGTQTSFISFSHTLCPLCKTLIKCSDEQIIGLLKPIEELKVQVLDKAKRRFVFDDEHRNPRFSNPNDEWFNKQDEYAIHHYLYYQCNQCRNPYFGGKRECGGNEDDVGDGNALCPSCVNPNVETDCPTHGKESIQWKCRFCCEIATFFCHGNTHYCESCHKRPGEVQREAKRNALPRCPGSSCPMKMPHPQPGTEHCLGCVLCREALDY